MDKIEEIARAIVRADNEAIPDYDEYHDNPEISDWAIHLARAAYEVMTRSDGEAAFEAYLAGYAAAKGAECVADLPKLDEYHKAHSGALDFVAALTQSSVQPD